MSAILVAGLGNIFNGDDGFGVEVVHRLAARPLPADVRIVDFGIRGLDLAYALADGYAAAILVDAARRGHAPGTVTIVEPEADDLHAHLNTVDSPLNTLEAKDLCPGTAALDKINAALR